MLKLTLKSLTKWDKGFLIFLLILAGLSIYIGEYWNLVIYGLFAVWTIILASYKATIELQDELIRRLLELSEAVLKGDNKAKVVRTITTEYTLERETKSNGKKYEDKANAGRSRSRKATGSKTGSNAKTSRPVSVPNRKPKATKKNS